MDFGVPDASLTAVNAQEFGSRYSSGLVSTTKFLISRGVPREMVPDIAQGAWLLAWERIHQLRDDSKIVSWVNTIALNQARRELSNSPRYTALTETVHPTICLNVAAIDLNRLMEQCKPGDRTLLQAELEGVAPEELAPLEGISNIGMRVRFFRARRAARDIQKSKVEHPEDVRFEQIVAHAPAARVKFAQHQIDLAAWYVTLAVKCSDHATRVKVIALALAAIKHAKQSVSKMSIEQSSARPDLASQIAEQERRIAELPVH